MDNGDNGKWKMKDSLCSLNLNDRKEIIDDEDILALIYRQLVPIWLSAYAIEGPSFVFTYFFEMTGGKPSDFFELC